MAPGGYSRSSELRIASFVTTSGNIFTVDQYYRNTGTGPFHGIGEVISKNKMFESRQNTNWMCYIYISTNLKTKIWVKMFTY